MIFLAVSRLVDTSRQLPATSALARGIELAGTKRPTFVVVRLGETEAGQALAAHLVKTGSAANTINTQARNDSGPIG